VARKLGQASAQRTGALATTACGVALLVQAKGVEAVARPVCGKQADGTAVGQTVHLDMVAFKAALDEQALGAETGFDLAQALLGQNRVLAMSALAWPVQVGPALVAINAALGGLVHCCAVDIIGAVVLDCGIQYGKCGQSKDDLADIITVQPICVDRCGRGQRKRNSRYSCDQWLKHKRILSVQMPLLWR